MDNPASRVITVSESVRRLDIYLKEASGMSRPRCRKLIDSGGVLVNGVIQRKYHRTVRRGDILEYNRMAKEKNGIKPFAVRLEIVHKENDLIAVNKPAGMLTHPTKFGETDTLVNGVKEMYPESSVHAVNRLDRDTSGIVAVALGREKAKELSGLIMAGKFRKQYLSLVHGRIVKKGKIEKEISRGGSGARSRRVVEAGGMSALTEYEPAEIYKEATLLKIIIVTGRTHQIRAHMKFIKHPCVGDPVYGDTVLDQGLFKGEAPKRQMLHAASLSFQTSPGRDSTGINAPLPEDMSKALEYLRERK